MVQAGIIISGVITLVLTLTLFLLSIFVVANNMQYNSTDPLTSSNLNDINYKNINNIYNYQCYGYNFEIYTNLDCESYLNANIANENINYYNTDCYPVPNANCIDYTVTDVQRFCRLFKNPNFCNVSGY